MEDRDNYPYEENAYIKRKPTWMIRRGIAMVFVFFVMVMMFASLFSYNESINTSLVLTTEDPPVHLRAKQIGRILDINNSPNDIVSKGDILGVLENTGNVQHIMKLKQKLTSEQPTFVDFELFKNQFPTHLNLGNQIRPLYNDFLNAYRDLLLYQNLNDEELKESELEQRYQGQNNTIENKRYEIQVLQRDLEISRTDYERYHGLFEKGVISLQELEQTEKLYLNVQRQFSNLIQELSQLQIEQSWLKNNLLLFQNSKSKNNSAHTSKLESEKQELLAVLKEWEDMYLLRSPISGRVSFLDVWAKHQNIEEGQVIFTIVPMDKQKLLGRCQVPIYNSGKIKQGQHVIIKLDNYPYREWGSLKGKVKTISEVPKVGENQGYVVYVQVDDLITSYGKTLEFKQEMHGNAKIILAEVSLIQRIFYQFRELWENIG